MQRNDRGGEHELMSDDTTILLRAAEDGCEQSLQQLLTAHRDRLKKMVSMRLHPLVRSRVDESDILQEAMLDASQRIHDYFEKSSMPFFLWLRFITNQKIQQCHRHHLDAQKRSAKNQHRLSAADESVSINLVDRLVSREASPSSVVALNEVSSRVRRALNALSETDREILSLRHFEQLQNAEVAEVLGISRSSASSRYLRAVAKLQQKLKSPLT